MRHSGSTFCVWFLSICMVAASIGTALIHAPAICSSCAALQTDSVIRVGGTGPHNYTSISYAMRIARPGQTVFVYAGIYRENINMKTGVTLMGEDPETTIINGSLGETVVSFYNVQDARIEGFTLCHAGRHRSGVYCYNCSPVVTNNIIRNNGKGILCVQNASPLIDRNIIRDNSGSGIDCSRATITNNTFTNNFNGVYCKGTAVIRDNVITHNKASGITAVSAEAPHISHNTITGNDQGVVCINASALIEHNTITNNTRNGISCRPGMVPGPGGIYIPDCNSLFPTICNNTISGNNCGITCSCAAPPLISDNDIIENEVGISFECGEEDSCSRHSIIFRNNFINNTRQAYDETEENVWYHSTRKEGNFWSDHHAWDNNSDGSADTPYFIPGAGHTDRYPAMEPWERGWEKEKAKRGIPDFQLCALIAAIMVSFVFRVRVHARRPGKQKR